MKLYSLRRATFTALLVPVLLAVVLVGGSGLLSAHRTISTLRDHEMEQEGAFLMVLSLHEATEGERLGVIHSGESSGLRDLHAGGTGFRIWSDNVIMTTAGSLPPSGAEPPPPGFSDITENGKEWRRYAVHHPSLPITIEVAEPAQVRDALTGQMAASLSVPMLLLIIAVSLIASFQIAAALRPMDEISRQIDARDTDELRPLEGYRIPREIAPLVVAVNDLMIRLGLALEREREFTDNAAHELRTPLAVLKTRAQIAERALEGMPGQQAELTSLVAAIDRAIGVIEQLLALSRLQSGQSRSAAVDLSGLTEEVARDLAPLAIAKQQDIDAQIAPGIMVQGNADSLSMVIRNLIDNAIRYAPAQGRVSIALQRDADGKVLLRVSDNGPGIAPEHRAKAFERFTRFSSNEQGSGLGLAIVDRVVKLHGGEIVLRQGEPQGLICEVRLRG